MRVTAPIVGAVGNSLHRDAARAVIERAISRSLARTDFRITRLTIASRSPFAQTAFARASIRATATAVPRVADRAPRLELIVEAADHRALARGMQGFQVSVARGLNAVARRRGSVFVDRYIARPMRRRR